MTPRLRLAVIGVGHLGKEHARILAGLPDVELVGVVDVNPEQAQGIARQYGTRAFGVHWPLLNLVDAAVVAVPTVYHHAIATDFISHGIPILVEKPFTSTLAQAEELLGLARQHSALVQVGHIERFNPAFEEIQRRPLQPKFIESQRVGPFTGRSTDIGVVLDLMIHDLDLLLTLVKSPVQRVEAIGATMLGGHEDVVHARISFANGCLANLTASRVSPRPMRRMRIWAPEGYISVDFARRHLTLVQPTQRFRHQGLDPRLLAPTGRGRIKEELFDHYLQTCEMDCNSGDQLTRELEHFVQCVRTNTAPRVSGEDACSAIALATRILDSVRSHAWTGEGSGPVGPTQLPTPLGFLFPPEEREAA
ncbi:MAG: Gfo/Idh/MocA family oxidoreductase [Gemmataceae bacterium]|nr:Gfo/Idh/MocA family oxidoreductase [Gemmataceae bacterium]